MSKELLSTTMYLSEEVSSITALATRHRLIYSTSMMWQNDHIVSSLIQADSHAVEMLEWKKKTCET